MSIEGNVVLTVDDLKTPEGLAQLNRMIDQLYKAVDEDSFRRSILLNIDDGITTYS